MISVQSLGLKRHSLVLELAEVYSLFLVLVEVDDTFNFSSASCVDLHQV
jgi:hypothetical protein